VKKISPDGSEVWTFNGHSNNVYGVAVDSEGYVYSGSYDDTVKKISPDGSEVWTFNGHSSTVRGVAVDSEGYVYSASLDDTVKKISPDGSEVWTFNGHSSTVYGVAVDSEGYVYSGSYDGTVKKISPDGSEVWTFNGHSSYVYGVAVDSDGFVYSGSDDGTVKKISPDGNEESSFSVDDNSAYSVSISPLSDDKHFLAAGTGSTNYRVYRWTRTFNSFPEFNSTSVSPDPPLIGENVSYSVEASDPDGNVSELELTLFKDGSQVYQDSVSQASYNWSDVYVPQSDGELDARFRATDDSGASTTEWINRTIDETPPQINIERPSGNLIGLEQDLNYSVSDPHLDSSSCSYSKDGGTNFSLESCGNTTIQYGSVGLHNVTIYADDNYNNTGKDVSEFFLDLENEIRAEDQGTGTIIEDFQVTLSNGTSSIGGQASNGSFKFNTSEAPTGEVNLTLESSGYKVFNESLQVDSSFSLNQTFSLERAGLYIDAKDEQSESDIDFNLSLSNSTDSFSKEGISEFQADYQDYSSEGIPTGDVVVSVESSGYQSRSYFVGLDENSEVSLTSYLLDSTQGIYMSIEVLSPQRDAVSGVDVDVQRKYGVAWKTVSQKSTATDGSASFFLDPESTYRVFIDDDEGSFTGTFSPVNYQYDPLQIRLSEDSDLIDSTVWDSVSYSLRPNGSVLNSTDAYEFNWTVGDSEGGIEGLELRFMNESGAVLDSVSSTGSPSGGTISSSLNLSDYNLSDLVVESVFWKDDREFVYQRSYDVRRPVSPGPASVSRIFDGLEGELSDTAEGLVALIFGWFAGLASSKSRLGKQGGGLIGLGVLGIFVLEGWFPVYPFLAGLLAVIGVIALRR